MSGRKCGIVVLTFSSACTHCSLWVGILHILHIHLPSFSPTWTRSVCSEFGCSRCTSTETTMRKFNWIHPDWFCENMSFNLIIISIYSFNKYYWWIKFIRSFKTYRFIGFIEFNWDYCIIFFLNIFLNFFIKYFLIRKRHFFFHNRSFVHISMWSPSKSNPTFNLEISQNLMI